MTYIAVILALLAGYLMGLLQNGININDNRTLQPEYDEEGNQKYNPSITALDEKQQEWINENRRV